jgi:ssDNA-binding Zn-finger/Zn-ribbon topoisomerase 1
MDSLDFTAVRCPYCKYVWAKRKEHIPVSCPRCKKRFDYPGNLVELEQANVSTDSDSTKKDWLTDANRHSLQYDSLDEILDKLEQQ